MLDSLEIFMLFRRKLAVLCEDIMIVQIKPMEIIDFFDEIVAKNKTQNRSWKFDENIFHQKCTKHHSLVTESVSGDDCDGISSKNYEFFMLFLT